MCTICRQFVDIEKAHEVYSVRIFSLDFHFHKCCVQRIVLKGALVVGAAALGAGLAVYIAPAILGLLGFSAAGLGSDMG
ncbi:hypothetical protein SCP_0509170 [Sparassis crispa]|uniref:Uncharacterized protein n=1 Tax=Sparassis crispa TaxID=139825 RepID=A0A401GNW3_9APHY|nr:hypothetical protein SCP_0509170 [Sparassis crispa]GBE83860.1 hypothetical protein SCP_0509170 [Sparassis crispa]